MSRYRNGPSTFRIRYDPSSFPRGSDNTMPASAPPSSQEVEVTPETVPVVVPSETESPTSNSIPPISHRL